MSGCSTAVVKINVKFQLSLLLVRNLKLFKLLLYIDGGQSLCSRLINARHLYAIVVVDRHLEIFDMFFYPGEKSTWLIASF